MLEKNGMSYFVEKINFDESKIRKLRMVLKDGDSFYRSFMFALIEHHIINNHQLKLKEILCDIGNHLDKDFLKNNTPINKLTLQCTLFSIIKYLQSNDIKKAYEIFIKSYFIDENWDIVRIIFMLIILIIFIIRVLLSI